MIDNLPLSFFLPLVVHSLAGMATGITGIVTFSMPKRRERHPRWGKRYLWAYTILFLTATILALSPTLLQNRWYQPGGQAWKGRRKRYEEEQVSYDKEKREKRRW